ncbi:DNA topoisomerase [Pseudomonas syringae pv. actinidiae]|nr:DNA topoisomerase [Pseudomonas syringae pv. actinidiae]
MLKNLFLIEAPGKTKHVKGLLEGLGVHDFEVVATKGRLYDLPSDRLGIKIEDVIDFEMIPCNPGLIEFISKKISAAESIYLMTDADHEGELIASDLKSLVPYYKECFRLEISSLTSESIAKALSSPRDISDDMVRGARARRIFDRICGFHLSSWSDSISVNNGTIGRVLSPVLNDIAMGKKSTSMEVVRNYSHAGKFYSVVVSGNSKDLTVKSVNHLLDSVVPSSFSAAESDLTWIRPSLMTGPEAIVEIAQCTGSPITEVSDSMQRLYERGLISYHRTDCREISSESLQNIHRLAFEAGESFESSDDRLMQEPQGAHEGIHITSLCPSLGAEYSSLSLDEKVYRMIYRSSVSLGKNLILDKSAASTNDPNVALLSGYSGVSVVVNSATVSERGYRKVHPYSSLAGLCPEISQGRSCPPSTEMVVAKCLLSLDVGRPSTFAYHCKKISELYLDLQGRPNFRAFASLNRCQQVAPMMTSPERVVEVNRILLSGRVLEDAVFQSFEEVGLSKEQIFGSVKVEPTKPRTNIELSME